MSLFYESTKVVILLFESSDFVDPTMSFCGSNDIFVFCRNMTIFCSKDVFLWPYIFHISFITSRL